MGGADQSVLAFQLPEASEPQRLMRGFMSGDNIALMSPLTFDAPIGKAGTQKELSKYINVEGAIGYTYFTLFLFVLFIEILIAKNAKRKSRSQSRSQRIFEYT